MKKVWGKRYENESTKIFVVVVVVIAGQSCFGSVRLGCMYVYAFGTQINSLA